MASWLLPYVTTEDAEQADDEPYTWSVHLLRRQPQRLVPIVGVVTSVLLVGLCLFHSLWLALLPVIAFVYSLTEYLFPVYYLLTAQSAKAQHGLTSLEIRWADVRRAYLTDQGVKLSPLRARNSRFEPLRGIYLRFDEVNRDTVITIVKQHLPEEKANG